MRLVQAFLLLHTPHRRLARLGWAIVRRKRTLESGAGAALLPFYFYFFIETISLVTAPSREFSSSSVVTPGPPATYRIRVTDLFYLLTPPPPHPGSKPTSPCQGVFP